MKLHQLQGPSRSLGVRNFPNPGRKRIRSWFRQDRKNLDVEEIHRCLGGHLLPHPCLIWPPLKLKKVLNNWFFFHIRLGNGSWFVTQTCIEVVKYWKLEFLRCRIPSVPQGRVRQTNLVPVVFNSCNSVAGFFNAWPILRRGKWVSHTSQRHDVSLVSYTFTFCVCHLYKAWMFDWCSVALKHPEHQHQDPVETDFLTSLCK